jgi:hypothetical protein
VPRISRDINYTVEPVSERVVNFHINFPAASRTRQTGLFRARETTINMMNDSRIDVQNPVQNRIEHSDRFLKQENGSTGNRIRAFITPFN